jgi:hypothetical protein
LSGRFSQSGLTARAPAEFAMTLNQQVDEWLEQEIEEDGEEKRHQHELELHQNQTAHS